MPKALDPREEALRALDERAQALKARTTPAASPVTGLTATSQAYKILAELIGGVLIGVALGAVADWLLPTAPWGLIGGTLAGFALSLFMARRTANRLMAQARAEEEARNAPTSEAGDN